MRKHRIALTLATGVLVAGLACSSLPKVDEISDVSKLPDAVQKTVNEQVADGTIAKLKKEVVGGKIAYGVQCTKGGKKWQIEVAPDGKLLLQAEEMTQADLPDAVQQTVQQNAAKGKVESIARVTEAGQTYYEAGVTFNGQEKTFIIGPDGKLIDTQIPENQVRLPDATGEDWQAPRAQPRGGYKE